MVVQYLGNSLMSHRKGQEGADRAVQYLMDKVAVNGGQQLDQSRLIQNLQNVSHLMFPCQVIVMCSLLQFPWSEFIFITLMWPPRTKNVYHSS